jgi:hypothetical protein
MPSGAVALSGYGNTGAARQTYQSIIANTAVIATPTPNVALDGNIVLILPTGYNPASPAIVKAEESQFAAGRDWR